MRRKTVWAKQQWISLVIIGGLLGANTGCQRHLPVSNKPELSSDKTVTAARVALVWEAPLHASPSPPSPATLQAFQALQQRAHVFLNSQRPYHEVEIPLTFQDGRPYVQASWSGRQIDCMLDTGTTPIAWPQWLHLETHQLHIANTTRFPEGITVQTEWMLSPHIAVGDLVLTDVPTEALGFARPKAAKQARLTSPILGMAAFSALVMTLDYRQKKLILRDDTYDITRRPPSLHSRLIRYKQDKNRIVILPGTLGEHKAQFLLDSGYQGMAVSAAFARRYLSAVPRDKAAAPQPYPVLHNIFGTIYGLQFKAPTLDVMEVTNDADILLGSSYFSKFRITMDPYRKAILIEYTGTLSHGMFNTPNAATNAVDNGDNSKGAGKKR